MRTLKIVLLVCFIICLTSCLNTGFEPDKWAINPELDFSKNTVLFNSTNSVDTVCIFTNYRSFTASSSENWCKVSIDNSQSQIVVTVEPNINVQQRSANVTISIKRGEKYLSKVISVVQMGGVWETIGNFNVYWGYEISESQRDAIVNLLTNMVYVRGGDFVMGKTDEEIVDATKPHSISLSSFYISKFEITQEQWRAIMGYNRAVTKGEHIPIYNISWSEAFEFASRLASLTHLKVSLPTEAQWEFAARGGLKSKGYSFAGSNDYRKVAVYNETSYEQEPTTVGSLECNELGLYDMSGNVAEYCFDWWSREFQDSTLDPFGPDMGTFKSVRGGHINVGHSFYMRTTNRNQWSNNINKITNFVGFRIIITE